MDDLKIGGFAHSPALLKSEKKNADAGFDSEMKNALSKVTEIQKEAEKAVYELTSGGDITKAIIAMEKADMSFQVMVEVRNKLLSAYEEIMRMQV